MLKRGCVHADAWSVSLRSLALAALDLVELGVSSTCAFIRTAGPLPARFKVQTTGLETTVKDGRVFTMANDGLSDAKPVRGIVAHLGPSLFVLRTPMQPAADGRIDLSVGRDGKHHDADWTPVRRTRTR